MEQVLEWDRALLLWINLAGKEPWDSVMWYGTQGWAGVPLYIAGLLWLIRRWGERGLRMALITGLIVGTTDLMSSHILKPTIKRLRPSHTPVLADTLRLLHNYRGGRYSFPSNHAANTAAGTLAFAKLVRHPFAWGIGLCWMIFHSLTRVYLGVHYPSDILGGWIVGIVTALILLRILRPLYG